MNDKVKSNIEQAQSIIDQAGSLKNKVITLNTSFGKDLQFKSMTGTEAISQIYDFKIEAVSQKDTAIDISKILGNTVDLEIETANNSKRYLSGDVVQVKMLGIDKTDSDYLLYSIHIKPWLWYLTRNKDYKIYQEMSVVDILDEVFSSYGGFEYEKRLTGNYRTRTYCVQYGESDFDFISRLMEHEGIYYYFKHEANKVTVVLCDDVNNIDKLPNYTKVDFNKFENVKSSEEVIHKWHYAEGIQGIEYVVSDYDFTKSAVDLSQTKTVESTISQASREIFEWQAGYEDVSDGEHYVKIRLEEERSLAMRSNGETNVRGFAVGYIFALNNALHAKDNKDYLIVSTTYNFHTTDSSNAGGLSLCNIGFIVQGADIPYRSKSVTPLPKTRGPQTAVVTGPAGEEIYTDKFQRIKVHFFWDRYNKADENSSCWIRISNDFAGDDFGALSPPRIGQEVIVDFIEGNPDKPVVVGRVYNDKKMPNEAFNPSPTKSGMIVKSFGDDSTIENASYFIIDAAKGDESVDLHAEKDSHYTVENDQLHSIGHDHTHNVTNDHTQSVGNNQTISVTQNQNLNIGVNQNIIVENNQTETINSAQTLTVKKDRTHIVTEGNETIIIETGKRDLTVQQDQTTTIHGNHILTVDKDESQTFTTSLHTLKYTSAGLDTVIHGNNSIVVDQNETETYTTSKHTNSYTAIGLTTNIHGVCTLIVDDNYRQRLTSSGHTVFYTAGKRETDIKGDDNREAVNIFEEASTSFKVKVGSSCIEVLTDKIVIHAGTGTITLDASGVKVEGAKIDLNA